VLADAGNLRECLDAAPLVDDESDVLLKPLDGSCRPLIGPRLELDVVYGEVDADVPQDTSDLEVVQYLSP
jgi:hypothetical protein